MILFNVLYFYIVHSFNLRKSIKFHFNKNSRFYSFKYFHVKSNNNDYFDYEYIDSGNYKRLEKFGKLIVERSCPSASWPLQDLKEWKAPNRLIYNGLSGKLGNWVIDSDISNWVVNFNECNLSFKLNPSDYGQIGVFPEQQFNWKWIRERLSIKTDRNLKSNIKVLNCFAYTGGATMALLLPGVEVTHLDASRSFINWTKRNIELLDCDYSNQTRFIIDDCMTFIDREIKRGRKYDGLILDPPAFGRADKGKVWSIQRDLPLLCSKIEHLLTDDPSFVLLTCHDVRFSEKVLSTLLIQSLPNLKFKGKIEYGELSLESHKYLSSKPLKLGYYARWSKK